jgi:hypothetical protein
LASFFELFPAAHQMQLSPHNEGTNGPPDDTRLSACIFAYPQRITSGLPTDYQRTTKRQASPEYQIS